MTSPILYDSHMHTPLCKHATGEPEAYAAQALERGLKGIIITCHSPMEGDRFNTHVRMRVDQFEEYVLMVLRAREVWAGQVDVRLGLESDYFPGYEDWSARLHDWAEFHYVLGSVHTQTSEYKAAFSNGDPVAFQRQYFAHLADAAETGLFDCLSHPDLVKNEYPDAWQPKRVMDDVRAALDRIAATGVAMELNTSGLNKRIKEMNPFPAMLAEMQARGIPVVLGSDSHEPGRVAADFPQALDLLESVGYTHVHVFEQRQPQAIRIEAARASLAVEAAPTA